MKKLLLNIIFGILVAIIVLSLTTEIVGIVSVNNGYTEFMIKELFTDIQLKILIICLVGIVIGICCYLSKKYEETNKFLSFIYPIIGIVVVIFLMNLTSYTIVFKITYISIICLTMCILNFYIYISNRKDIQDINKKLEANKREEK